MQFKPKSDKEIHEENLMPPGIYPFQVTTADNKISKAGNEMIQLEIRVFTPDGRTRSLNDYLMEKIIYKLSHFCKVTGLDDKYNSGTLQAEDCVGREGFVKITIKSDKTGQYPDQNSVADYLSSDKPNDKTARAEQPRINTPLTAEQVGNSGPVTDDDVPF